MSIEVKVRFEKARDYRIITATGCWGGFTPQGMVFMDLTIERKDLPEEVVLVGEEGRAPVEDMSRRREGDVVREAQVGLILTPERAYSIGRWLMERAEMLGVTGESAPPAGAPHDVQ